MAFEVCARLPIKELFKCMRASRAWRSTILHHPGFPDAFRRHNSSVLVVSAYEDGRRRFYYSSLADDEFVASSTVSNPGKYIWIGTTGVINGLVCLYDLHTVYLYNTLNGEVMRLPEPPPLEDGLDLCVYSFGFDPVNREYKLLRMIYANQIGSQASILTLGTNSSWRKLPNSDDRTHRSYPTEDSFLVNGVLYWKGENELVSFNLSQEKFILIPTPDDRDFCILFCCFAQFRGRLSLFPQCGTDSEKLILYMLDYNSESGYVWTRHETMLPSGLHTPRLGKRAIPVGSLPTGEILLADAYSGGTSTIVYSYNYEKNTGKNTFKRFTLGKLPASISLRPYDITSDFAIYSVEPNFGTLDSLIHGGRDIR